MLQQQIFLTKLSLFDQKEEQKKFLNLATAKQLQKYFLLDNKLLKSATCLHSNFRKKEYTVGMIKNLVKSVPHIVNEKEVSMNKIHFVK